MSGMERLEKYRRVLDFIANGRLTQILALAFLPIIAFWLLAAQDARPEDFRTEKINLALRRTADQLLRLSGDSTSRIPAIEQTASGTWRVRMEKAFDYNQLPALLQSSLDLHGLDERYNVLIRSCEGDTINLGYNKLDYTKQQNVACGGRAQPSGCHFIEVTFLSTTSTKTFWVGMTGILLLLVGAGAGFWLAQKKRKARIETENAAPGDNGKVVEWISFGQTKLDVAGQIVVSGGKRESLTFRETKLLQLFANNVDRILDRETIIQQVWADEGVLVGRSVDVFVSRLRKKIAEDPTLSIAVVHGVGYRLEQSTRS